MLTHQRLSDSNGKRRKQLSALLLTDNDVPQVEMVKVARTRSDVTSPGNMLQVERYFARAQSDGPAPSSHSKIKREIFSTDTANCHSYNDDEYRTRSHLACASLDDAGLCRRHSSSAGSQRGSTRDVAPKRSTNVTTKGLPRETSGRAPLRACLPHSDSKKSFSSGIAFYAKVVKQHKQAMENSAT